MPCSPTKLTLPSAGTEEGTMPKSRMHLASATSPTAYSLCCLFVAPVSFPQTALLGNLTFMNSSSSTTSSQVLTLSIHHSAPGFFPVSPLASLSDPSDPSFDPFTLSLPLAQGTSSASIARIWPCAERVKDAFQPDYVVVQCGVDGLAGDPYATWNLALADGEGSLGWCIERICAQWQAKILLLGGGGYNSPNAARAWTYLTSIALGCTLSPEADIPDHAAFPLYAPSFTLDFPAGNVRDQNTPEYLDDVCARFSRIAELIAERIQNPA
ncbi:hypothetical protein EIP91_004450 [Steccherinum ochraceum]|uniref:Histone deacetylase domain-containing protein n=1 Tax=Steccherinum ochraceum TaxID=92696 RepID=A0A4R0RK62_9APHY|nr:hypothetical protein EIP91_004450 [Steccherinum ochraceum]